MAQDLPGAEEESRSLRQRSTLPAWRALRCSREVFKTHSVVYERGEDDFGDENNVPATQDILPCEVAAVCDVADHLGGWLEH